jgi:hypothetical protein
MVNREELPTATLCASYQLRATSYQLRFLQDEQGRACFLNEVKNLYATRTEALSMNGQVDRLSQVEIITWACFLNEVKNPYATQTEALSNNGQVN